MPASAQTDGSEEWVLPRTEYGYPDLQGNWSNATITTLERPDGFNKVMSPEQIAAIEGERQDVIAADAAPSDPDREPPPVGGYWTGNPVWDSASGGSGGYNYFYIDAGDSVARWNGEPRSSLLVNPENGRFPTLTEAGQAVVDADRALDESDSQYDNPESRPFGERCLLSFGNNLGPPMVPNSFYNNNYTIVQNRDQIMIMTEMVHDYRVIRLGERQPLPDHIRPWFGDPWGHWEGDTLVVETTNLPLKQVNSSRYRMPGGSEQMKITERFTRVGPRTINYEFTIDDPGFYTASWGGEVPFNQMDEFIYEYACHEANYSLFNVLSGARAEEAAALDSEEN
jgi:hypothetical protein